MLNEIKTTTSTPYSEEQFAHLGGGSLAYLREIRSEDVSRLFPQAPPVKPGMQLFALLAADGTPLVVTDTRDAALANAYANELVTLSVH
ncbi:DUF1150 domain-containing protein [Methylovirgula sp. HY1]|uniref:BQ00720 family protein n=1 Tax=Methylovirgula sp. HY1 TaxID=2822761 RepID=UPI001C5BF872|nr:DUF1150 domain-containing protein [Methylovirgula sp. HY1]QXX75982.1 hypothetical protein MHY1_02816 [Methylovirgula sp. HY1]